MGGTSKSTTTQNSTTAPWEPAQNTLTGIISGLNSYLPQTGLTGTQNQALGQIEQNNGMFSGFAPQVQGYTGSLLNGGGALNQAGNVNQNYQNYYNATNPLASNTNYDPMQTPGIGDQLAALKNDISSSINGQFAAAGRDMSPANTKALSAGLTQGLAPVLTSQYNQNVQNQQGAAGNLYGAGNTNAGILSGLQQQYLANQGAGVGSIGTGVDALNTGAKSTLAAEAERLGIPLQNLGMLANIGVPIAGLGGTSSGTSNTTNQMSGVDQFGKIMSGIGGFGTNGQGGMSGSGLMGLLSFL